MSLMNLLQSEDPAIQNGLLNFGLSLLQSKGNFGNAVGQAGVAGQLGARDYRRQQELLKRSAIGDQLLQQQLADQQHRAKIRDLPAQFNQTLPQGIEGPQGFDTPGYLQALSGLDPLMALQTREAMRQRTAQPIKLGEGDQLLDPNTYKPVASNPKAIKPADLPNAVQEYQFAASQGYKGTFNEWVKEKAKAGAAMTSVSYGGLTPVQLPDGSLGYAQGSNRGGAQVVPGIRPPPESKSDKPLTEAQAKAATFKSQMEAAERELAGNPIDTTKLGNQIDIAVASTGANIFASPSAQRARQAQEQWAEAFLRFKTGAASTEAEVKRNVKTFFPQQGDSKEVISQKARMRQQAVNDLGAAATGKVTATVPAGKAASGSVNWSDLK